MLGSESRVLVACGWALFAAVAGFSFASVALGWNSGRCALSTRTRFATTHYMQHGSHSRQSQQEEQWRCGTLAGMQFHSIVVRLIVILIAVVRVW